MVKWAVNGTSLVLSSRADYAGAISSINYAGNEYINGSLHGYLLQGAIQFDGGAECFNPTQAGSRTDEAGYSSSRLLSVHLSGRSFKTSTQMAYWTPPGRTCTDASGARSYAWNQTVLSDTVYDQQIELHGRGPAVILIDNIQVTLLHHHSQVGLEAVTGYLPTFFSKFYDYLPEREALRSDPELLLHSQERSTPLVLTSEDGARAMGIVALRGRAEPHYAGFHNSDVSKWSLVYHWPQGLRAGKYRFKAAIILGTRDQVTSAIASIQRAQSVQTFLISSGGTLCVLTLLFVMMLRSARRHRVDTLKPIAG